MVLLLSLNERTYLLKGTWTDRIGDQFFRPLECILDELGTIEPVFGLRLQLTYHLRKVLRGMKMN